MAPVSLPQTAFAAEIVAAHSERQQAVVAEPVVVAEVLIPEHKPEQALGRQALEGMLAPARIAVIGEAGGQPPGQAAAMVNGLQQQGVTIGGGKRLQEYCRHQTNTIRHALEGRWCQRHPRPALLHQQRSIRGLLGISVYPA